MPKWRRGTRDAYDPPGMEQLVLSLQNLVLWDFEFANELRREFAARLTITDATIARVVSQWYYIDGRGTRQQILIDLISVPRRSIRNSLRRLTVARCLIRENGFYYPTQAMVEFHVRMVPRTLELVENLSTAWLSVHRP